MQENKDLFTAKEACSFLKISPVTLWRERKAGKISFRRIASKLMFTRADLEEYLDRCKNQGASNEMEVTNV